MDFNKLLESLQNTQTDLQSNTYQGQASNGLVKLTLDFSGKLLDFDIDASILNPEDKDMIVDLIQIAFNDAHKKLEAESNKQLSNLTKGFKF